jgi:hypothetical protein
MSNETQPPSFMDRVRALRSEHTLCAMQRNGQKVAALHAVTSDDRITLYCDRCRASWSLTITPDDARQLQEYVDERRQQSDEGSHGPEARG